MSAGARTIMAGAARGPADESGWPPPRHAVIRVDPQAWPLVLPGDTRDDPLVADWAARGWPVVARRRGVGDPARHVPVGLPLPPTRGGRRLALALPHAAVRAVEPPVTLRAVRATAPPRWAASIAAIEALGARHGLTPRVFGSFAWAALTGLDYLTPTSDLDLLWPLSPDTPRLLTALDGLAAPGRIDGEVVHRGAAVQWRELHGALAGGRERGDVLVKTLDGVLLRPARAFLGMAT